jgi:predicted DNA-binding transcriptional regulator YafY
MISRALTKAERLLQVEALLLSHPDGLRKAEIAARIGIDRSTAGRYVTALTDLVPLVEEDTGKVWIDRSRYLPPIRLTPNEIESIRLAFRLFSRKIRFPFPHAASSLRKLALAAERVSPALSRRLSETADSMDSHHFPAFTRRYREVMETLIAALSEHKTVCVRHLSMRRGRTDEYSFQPYCLEPYPDGNSIHAIGFCPDLNEMRTFKLERIRSVHATEETFQPPAEFDIDAYTSAAWGIWGHAGRKPVSIVLRFSAAVAERVKETVWHESQSLEDCPDGGLLFRACVAEPLEMYPWIRGWGADVEILESKELRERFRGEVQRMKKLYGVE